MYLFHDTIGLIHLIAAICSLFSGTTILFIAKGTQLHKKAGYIYVVSMVVTIITAFMIYRLWGGWGIFHYAAIISSVTLLGGMIPVITRYPTNSYIILHFSFMYWSVIGLYGAFFAEIMTRVPPLIFSDGTSVSIFLNTTGITVAIVMAIGGYYFYKHKDNWEKQFLTFTKTGKEMPTQ
jgi:uncharacterized membrane protein